jgi:penicillin-binding protein 1A
VSPVEMVAAYAAFANGGISVKPYTVIGVVNKGGEQVYWHEDERRRGLEPFIAASMNAMLKSVVRDGTGKAARSVEGAAGKTGTGNNNGNAWFIGYTKGQVTGVLVQSSNASGPLSLVGGDVAGIWASLVKSFQTKR